MPLRNNCHLTLLVAGLTLISIIEKTRADSASSSPDWAKMQTKQAARFKSRYDKDVTDGNFILTDVQDSLTMWAHFEVRNGNLEHTHCRAVWGNDDKKLLYIPLDACYKAPREDNDAKSIYDSIEFGCRKSSSSDLEAAVSPSGCYKTDDKKQCRRLPDSNWCGIPAGILKSPQCRASYEQLQSGKNLYWAKDGSIPFNDAKDRLGEEYHGFFGCKNDKLIVEKCAGGYSTDFQPGEFLFYQTNYYACPKSKPLEKEDLKNIDKSFAVVKKKDDPALAGLKQRFPKGYDSSPNSTRARLDSSGWLETRRRHAK